MGRRDRQCNTACSDQTEQKLIVERRQDIDGLRGLAVLLVIFFHAGWLRGGFVGVDIFCVISGYFMSQRALLTSSFSPWHFMARRIQRLLPALLFMVTLVCAAMLWWLLPLDRTDIAQNGVSALLYVSNIWAHSHVGYFAGSSLAYPFLHTWSLSVEMQFYLLILLLGMARLKWGALILIAMLSLMISLSGWGVGYYGLPDRLWQFALGGIIAWLPEWQRRQKLLSVLSLSALALIVACGVLYSNHHATPSLWTLIPCAATALILLLKNAPAQRCLNVISPLGRISYSLYLWHWPIIVGATYLFERQISGYAMVMALTVSLIMSMISYRFIKKPFSCRGLLVTNALIVVVLYGITLM